MSTFSYIHKPSTQTYYSKSYGKHPCYGHRLPLKVGCTTQNHIVNITRRLASSPGRVGCATKTISKHL